MRMRKMLSRFRECTAKNLHKASTFAKQAPSQSGHLYDPPGAAGTHFSRKDESGPQQADSKSRPQQADEVLSVCTANRAAHR